MTEDLRSSNPFYAAMMTSTLPAGYWKTPVRIFRSCVDSEKSCHCSDSVLYFGMARERWAVDQEELDDETEDYIDLLQQVVTNFIRTGDPNDYTGSPTNHSFDTIMPFHQTQMFNYIGTSGQWNDVASQEQCDMFDQIDEYFEH